MTEPDISAEAEAVPEATDNKTLIKDYADRHGVTYASGASKADILAAVYAAAGRQVPASDVHEPDVPSDVYVRPVDGVVQPDPDVVPGDDDAAVVLRVRTAAIDQSFAVDLGDEDNPRVVRVYSTDTRVHADDAEQIIEAAKRSGVTLEEV